MLATGSFDAGVGIRGVISENEIADEEDHPEAWRFAVVLVGHEAEVKSVARYRGRQILNIVFARQEYWGLESLCTHSEDMTIRIWSNYGCRE